jgi:peptidyl-prolyl cis-trans isomerase B (cyclophilin B)
MSKEKRDRQRVNREARREAERKAQRRANLRKSTIRWGGLLVAFLATFAVLSFLSRDDGAPDESIPIGPGSYQEFRDQAVACDGAGPGALVLQDFTEPADQGLSGTVSATLATSCGDIEIEMDADASPETVNSFVFLAREGYFDNTACHRLVPGFVLQCGDPTATGTGGPGYTIADEFPDAGFSYEKGVVAMANGGAGTTGSQFFIALADTNLGPAFSVLGRVVGSEDTLAALAEIPLGQSPIDTLGEVGDPLESIYIQSVTISE